MPLSEMIIRSKLIPPRSQKEIFHRPRLIEKLKSGKNYPITLLHAGTGYGKTTALLELCSLYKTVYWYNITEPDRDPTLFIAHLVSAFLPGSKELIDKLENGGGTSNSIIMTSLINQLTTDLEDETILVLDDFHLVSNIQEINNWLEQLVERHPPQLNIAVACRQIPETPAFIRWRGKGNVQIIDLNDLSFSQKEIRDLFLNHYHFPITDDQAKAMYNYTDGWIIALQMIWQRLQSSRSRNLDNILNQLPEALSDIFTFLAQEVLARQPEPIIKFLKSSAVLRQMVPSACDYLLDSDNSHVILEQLVEKGLFISGTDSSHYRYQRLFQDFLLNQGRDTTGLLSRLHSKAAKYFILQKQFEEAIHHLLAAGDTAEASAWIIKIGRDMINMGRLETLSGWLDQLRDSDRIQFPFLDILQGDVLRLKSDFEQAIDCFSNGDKRYHAINDLHGRSLALRGKAQVYLDTIRPIKASSLLEEAVSLLEPHEYPQEMAQMLDQLAENKLNMGSPDEARELHNEALLLRADTEPRDYYLDARSLLRTGRLFEARDLLESTIPEEFEESSHRPQMFHREASLLLSLICSMLGDLDQARRYALKGVETGKKLGSPFVQAVGYMRLGHTYQMSPQPPWRTGEIKKAADYYEQSLDLVKVFKVMRVQVEPLWGLCRLHGYHGDLKIAGELATQAIDISLSAGDHWFAALINTTLGISHLIASRYEQAGQLLEEAAIGFQQVGDQFGQLTIAAAKVALQWHSGNKSLAIQNFSKLASELKNTGYDFILTKSNHLGMSDPLIFFPLMIEAYQQGMESEWLGNLLRTLNLDGVDYHPGYRLFIRSLGLFEVWRGTDLINPRDWQREKARQLFQLLLSSQGKWQSREQLADKLWPQLDADSAMRNLKVAFNALYHAVEPDKGPKSNPFFIIRRENLYGLNPSAVIEQDVDEFLELSKSEDANDLQDAQSIYRGDYLPECMDESWTIPIRSQLHEIYLQTAMKLIDQYLKKEAWEDAIRMTHTILKEDSHNEQAYRVLMKCHAARGNISSVQSVYQRCRKALRAELDMEPSAETTRLWKELLKTNSL